MNRTICTLLLGLVLGSGTLESNASILRLDEPVDTLVADTIQAEQNDSITAEKKEKPKKESEYEKLMKKGGTKIDGLFTVRHIEDKYYFEIPDSMLGRMMLCVSRFTAVPQDFGKFAGEEVNNMTFYFEQRDTSQILMRQYVLSQVAADGDNIRRTLELASIDPIVMALKVIGQNEAKDAQLVEVTSLFKGGSKFTSASSGLSATLKLGGIQSDRTYIDTMKVYPTNIEVVTTRTYGASAGVSGASKAGAITLGLNTSIVLLPKEPMRKRLWDARVGYFVNSLTGLTYLEL